MAEQGMSGAEAQAWDADCLERERREALTLCALVIGLNPPWALLDHYVQPSASTQMLWLRIAMSVVTAVAAWVIRASSDLARVRNALLTALAVVSTCTAVIVVYAVDSYPVYVLGFSTILWGTAVLLSWPATTAGVGLAAAAVALLATHGLAAPLPQAPSVLIASAAYLGSSILISFAASQLRRRLQLRVFRASYGLGHRNAELSHALARLEEAQSRLVESEKLSALGRLLAGLAHEINNPMNVIANNMDPVQEYFESLERVVDAHRETAPERSPADLERLYVDEDIDFVRADFRQALSTMREAVARILDIQENLRVFIRDGSSEATLGDVNVGLRATVATIRPSLPQGVELHLDLGALPQVRARFDRLNQVYFNLLQNAVDAVRGRGTIRVETRADADHVEIAVSDDGCGIPSHLQDRVFEPFFSTKSAEARTGLGLPVCHQIVSDHGGTLSIDTSQHVGARFVVRIPIACDRSEPRRSTKRAVGDSAIHPAP